MMKKNKEGLDGVDGRRVLAEEGSDGDEERQSKELEVNENQRSLRCAQ